MYTGVACRFRTHKGTLLFRRWVAIDSAQAGDPRKMSTQPQSQPVLEGLYQIRDTLDEVVPRMRQLPVEDVVASLSSLRTVSLSILMSYNAFVEALDATMQHTGSEDVHVQVAAQQIHETCTRLTDVVAGATDSQSNIAALRREQHGL